MQCETLNKHATEKKEVKIDVSEMIMKWLLFLFIYLLFYSTQFYPELLHGIWVKQKFLPYCAMSLVCLLLLELQFSAGILICSAFI